MTDLKLTQQDAPRAQGSLFREPTAGKRESDLLIQLSRLAGFATVDDLLTHSRAPETTSESGLCTHCRNYAGDVRRPLARARCPVCNLWTVRAATVLAGERPDKL